MSNEANGGVRVSSWVAGIAAAVAVGAIATAAAAIRNVDRLDVRVEVLERQSTSDRQNAVGVPAQLARLEEQMKGVQAELTKVSAKLDEKPRR
jgi:septal ring factor EnvC (AmiA/AmiB activator)